MKRHTVTQFEGENLGPVDWSFDFLSWGWDKQGCMNPGMIAGKVQQLKVLAESPEKYEATTDGGSPRCGFYPVIAVGTYDGWPYWKPIPSVCLLSWAGPEWHSWADITDIRRKRTQTTQNGGNHE